MQALARLEICTSDNAIKHCILYYCTLLPASWSNPVTSPAVQSTVYKKILKISIGSCTDLSVDSGSGSNLKY